MFRTSSLIGLALVGLCTGVADAGWHHRHYYPAYGYPAYPVAAAYYPMAPAAYQIPVAPQLSPAAIDEAQLARLLEQSLGAARARGFAAAPVDNGMSAEMAQVQRDLADLKAQVSGIQAKVDEHDVQIRSIQEDLKALKAALMK